MDNGRAEQRLLRRPWPLEMGS